MTAFPPALKAHLDRDVTSVCHCWKLVRADGATSGFTDHDRRLVVDGVAFEPETGFSATEARASLGLSVDTVDIEGALSSAGLSEDDIAAGRLDGATVETLLVNWRQPADFARLRIATIGKITRQDGRFVAELESAMRALDQRQGRIVTRHCDAEVGDAQCRVVLGGPQFSGVGTVVSLEGEDTIVVTGLAAFAGGWLTHGAIAWTSGVRAGLRDRVRAHRKDNGVVRLTVSPGGPAAPGDAFVATAGCDKRFATCKAKFANVVNFRGFPHLPGNDAAYAYAAGDGEFDGGALVP